MSLLVVWRCHRTTYTVLLPLRRSGASHDSRSELELIDSTLTSRTCDGANTNTHTHTHHPWWFHTRGELFLDSFKTITTTKTVWFNCFMYNTIIRIARHNNNSTFTTSTRSAFTVCNLSTKLNFVKSFDMKIRTLSETSHCIYSWTNN